VNRTLILFTALSLMAAPALADETFSLKVGYATLAADGEFAGLDGNATRIDFKDDLGFDNSQSVIAEAALQLGAFRFSAGYLPLSYSGRDTLSQNITFGGQTFPASTSVKSDVDIKLYNMAAAMYLVNFDDTALRVQFGPEVGVTVADVDMSMRDMTLGTREDVSVTAPVPTVGARGRVAFADYLGVVGRVGYLQVRDNRFLDADVQAEFSPVPLVGIFAGYKYLDLKVDESSVYVDSTFSGPYAGVMIRF
jgi:hypothetical protein